MLDRNIRCGIDKINTHRGRNYLIIGVMLSLISAGLTFLPRDIATLLHLASSVRAQSQNQSPSGKSATDGPPPDNLQVSEPNSVTSPGRQVLINFDELSTYTLVANQYPDASFSTDSSNYVIATPQNYGTSLPNISRAYRFGPWTNGFPPYNHVAPLVVSFTVPVNNLGFHVIGVDYFGVIAQLDIYQNRRYTTTVPIYGNGSKFVPVWHNVGAGYGNVTSIEVKNITDGAGIAFDNFSFTVPPATPTPTPTPTPAPSPSPTPPTAPTNLKAIADELEVQLSWTPSSSATSYSIKRTLTSSSSSTGGDHAHAAASFVLINTISCSNPSIPCTYYVDSGLSSDTTYTYVVSAANSVGTSPDSLPATAKPLPKPGCEWKNMLVNPPNGGNPVQINHLGWSLKYAFSARDGLVVTDVYLNGRRMANRFSIPYFKITTRNSANPTAPFVAERGELRPNGSGRGDGKLFSRLISYKIEPRSDELFIQADYGIENIPGTPGACLKISQIYEFFQKGFQVPHDPHLHGPCEPSGTIPTCTKFRPLVTYTFHGGNGETLSSINIPQRLHFQVRDGNPKPNTFVLTRDKDDWRLADGLANFYPFSIAYNPVLYEGIASVVRPGFRNKDVGSLDNFHQTNQVVFVPPEVHVFPRRWIEPGCPECVHMHWRWSKQVTAKPFAPPSGAGHPLVFPGSTQSLDIALLLYKQGEEEHPTDFGPLANGEQIAELAGNKLRRDAVLWYSPHGFTNTDTFFWNPAWFNYNDPTAKSSAIESLNSSTTNSHDGPVSVTFGEVYQRGTTSFSLYDLNSIRALPAGYAPLNGVGHEVSTTATVSGPHTINFNAASVTDQSIFNNLRIFQVQPDEYDPEKPVWVDCTILSPETPSPSFATRTLSCRSEGFGVFAIAQLVQNVPPDTTVADLSVGVLDSSDPITADNDLTYTISVTNNGPQTATEVAFINGLSADVDLVSINQSQGTNKVLDGKIFGDLGTLPVGSTATVTIVVTPTERSGNFPMEGKMIFNAISVRGKQVDNNSANNAVTQTTNVLPNPNQGPTVTITSPTNANTVVGPADITIDAIATDSDGSINSVQFVDNDRLLGHGIPAGNDRFFITAQSLPFGQHKFVAIATDNGGRVGVSEPIEITVNGLATVNITSPASASLWNPGSNISLTATASNPSGNIDNVEFFANGVHIGEGVLNANGYNYTWSPSGSNNYSIVAVVTDASGIKTISAPVDITVGIRPSVSITTPTQGMSFPAGTNISVSANAEDADGSIARVDFYANGILIGSASDIATTRFTATWRHVTDGIYSVVAVATDNLGLSNVSPAVNIGINTVSPRPGEYIWFDDSLPAGATPFGDGETWHWVDANPGPFLGQLTHQSRNLAQLDVPNTSAHQHYFLGATAQLPVNVGDTLFTYVFLDINNLPREIMLQWHDGNNWEHRAYWGQNRIGFGTDGTNSRRYMGPLPTAGQWVRLEIPASAVGLEGATVSGMAFTLDAGRATWDASGKVTPNAAPPPSSQPGDSVWIEDALPSGAIPASEHDHWEWVSSAPTPFSGQSCHRSFLANSTGTPRLRSHSFSGAQTEMQINLGDVLFTYVYLDPTFTPDEIVVQWHDGTSWEHRAFWGRNFADIGVTGTESRRYAGGLPPAGVWRRLEIPASYVGLEGKTVSGMAFGYYKENDRARVSWDRSGKNPKATSVPLPLSALTPLWRIRGTGGSGYYRFTTRDVAGWDETFTFVGYVDPKQAAGTVPFHAFRESNDFNSKFFYSTNRNGAPPGWLYVGIAFYVYPDASTPGTVPLHLFSDNIGYFYTTNLNEGAGKTSHGIVGYISTTNPLVPAPPSHLHYDGWFMRWKDNSGTETGFKVERRENFDLPWNQVAVVPANTTFWKIGSPSNLPQFRVRATNSFGDSAYSSIECGCWVEYLDSPNTAPEIYIASPANGNAVSRDFTVSVNVFDNNGAATIVKVELYADSVKLSESTEAPYLFVWNNAPSGLHTLTAVATDAAGTTKTSAPVTVTVSGPPVVSITSPTSGAVFTAPASVEIQANASDSDGSISKVEFFQGEVKIGEDVTAPYSFTWTNVPAGNYQLAAKAVDNNGLSASSTFVSVTVNIPPTIGITSPANGLVVDAPANLTISASALDNDGTISTVDFYRGTTLIGTDTSFPYSVAWNGVGDGVYSLTAKATDNRGAITTSAAIAVTVNSPPTVNITSPANGLVVDAPANLTISASALDSDGTINKVDFYRGTTLIGTDTTTPYAIAWNGVGYGVYSLTVKATDNRGSIITSAAVTITVNSPPTVSITSPVNGLVVNAPANLTISANALDNDGTVNKVDFYQGTTLIGTDTSSPYSITWNNVGYGAYSLTAKATDNRASVTSSPAVSVTVNNPPGSNQIIFSSNRDGSAQLYSMYSDGTDPIRRTDNSANDECPRWSPNNTRIVFQSDRENPFSGLADIYVMNPDGSGQTRLTTDPADDSAPVWSPDGTKIAFQSARNGLNYQVYLMNADGSGQVNISNSTANDGQPSWSPDGTKIAFTSDRDHPGKASIYVMNTNGSNQTRLTLSAMDVTDDQPMWSPDGTRIAFVSTRDSIVEAWEETDENGDILIRTRLHINKEVYVMNADGTNQIRLTNTLENDDSPVWSRDGAKLLFRSDRERECCDPVAQIWVMNSDGSNQVNLSNNSFGDFGGSW